MYSTISLERLLDLREKMRAVLARAVGEVVPATEEQRYNFSQRFCEVARGEPDSHIFIHLVRVSMPRDNEEIMMGRIKVRVWLEFSDGNRIILLDN